MAFKRNQGKVSIAGIDFSYIREGTGKPILVIGSAVYYSKAFSPELREHVELIFVDLRHFVGSYKPNEEELKRTTFDTFVDDVEALRQKLDLNKVALLGHSIQAQIALRYAVTYPQHLSHIILVDGVPYAFAEYEKEAEDFWEKHASDERKRIFEQNLEQLEAILSSTPENQTFAVIFKTYGPKFWRNPSFDASHLLEGVENSAALDKLREILPTRAEVRQSLKRLKIPTLVVQGKYDFGIPYTIWEDLVSDLDNITFEVLSESSHSPQTEHSETFDPQLISWLADH
jgi:proline iminopeptidase